MTAFLKIDECRACHRALPWEWLPVLLLGGKPLAGTGVWRSTLIDGICPICMSALEAQRQKDQRAIALRGQLIALLGGEKPFREFTFEHFEITPANQLAYNLSKQFNPATDSLYLWGPCGVGKSHLACAIARRCFEQTSSVIRLMASQLSRQVRMKDPVQEQAAIDEFTRVDMLCLDDLGRGIETAFARQVLQEILEAREYNDRAGLVITSQYSLDDLAAKLADDSIPSRLAEACQVVEIRGPDHRLSKRGGTRDSRSVEATPSAE